MTRSPLASLRVSCALCLAFPIAGLAGAVSSGLQAVPGQVLPILSTLKAIGQTAPGTVLHLAVSLQPAHPDALQEFCDRVSDPASPDYRQFITPEEVGARFGASKADVDAVEAYMRQQGMNVKLVALNRMAILADATVAQAETAFHTQISDFEAPDPRGGGRLSFHANTKPALLPAALGGVVVDISGLQDYTRPKPLATTTLLNPPLTRVLYNTGAMYSAGYQGAGRTLAISNWDGFRLTNVPLYYAAYNLPSPPGGPGSNITVVTIDGGAQNNIPQAEGDLDIQMELGMAPLANLIVYDGPASAADPIDTLTREANDNLADVISESWGWTVTDSAAVGSHNQHLAMTAQGITYMAASGDSGTAWLASWPYPPTDPDVLMVGGTTATVDSSTGVRTSETGWSGSGGGWVVNSWPFNKLPSWQKGTGVPTNVNYRLVPDVALHSSGSRGAYTFFLGGNLTSGYIGTSFASPGFAGSLAVAEQRLISLGGLPPNSAGKRRLGRVADLFYSQNGRADVWHDITSGNNGTLPNGNSSNCTNKWDSVTGWGVPDFTAFVSSQISVGTTPTTLALASLNVQVGSPLVLQTATLVKTSGAVPLSGELVGFSVNGVVSGNGTTDASGVATLTLAIPESLGTGTFPMAVVFGGDTTYAASSGTATLTVTPVNTHLALPDQTGSLLQDISLTATLTRTSDGGALVSKQVSFTIDGVGVGSATTNASGIATVDYVIPLSLAIGPHTVQASFGGNNLYNPSTGASSLTVLKGDTQTTGVDSSGEYGQTVSLYATVTRAADSVVLPGKTVNFYIAGNLVGSVTTNSSGLASFDYTIPSSLPPGSNGVTATFPGDGSYNTSSGTATLTVSKANTATTAGAAGGSYGQSVSLTATLKRTTDNTVLSGKSVAVTVDGSSAGSATTNGSGVATLSYTITTSLATGSHTIGASFAGDAQYNSSSGSGTLSVSKANTALAAGDATGAQGGSANLTATLTRTTDNAVLSGKSVSFLVDGSGAGTVTTDGSGVATLSYSIPGGMSTGPHAIFALFNGDAQYNSSSGNATLTVTSGTTAQVSGTVTLDGLAASPAGQTSTIEFRTPSTTTVVYSTAITLDGSGSYTANNVPPGTYDVAVKFSNWLRQVVPGVVVSAPTTSGVNFTLPNGDANNDNSVNLLDLSTVLSKFGTSGTAGSPGDLNWDGSVNLLDMSIVLSDFGKQGDQ